MFFCTNCIHCHKIYVDNNTCHFFSLDEPLLPRDRAALQDNEMFLRMSCIRGITTRLCDRSVLHEDAVKHVTDCLEEYGPRQGASRFHRKSDINGILYVKHASPHCQALLLLPLQASGYVKGQGSKLGFYIPFKQPAYAHVRQSQW